MLNGSCHCGEVSWNWTHPILPEGATACNCTVCRRYGALWIYDFEGEGITVSGSSFAYIRGKGIEFHFCPKCGCVAFWRGQQQTPEGKRRIAANLRLTDPEPIAQIPIDHFDGLVTFEDLPRDGKCVADLWF